MQGQPLQKSGTRNKYMSPVFDFFGNFLYVSDSFLLMTAM